MADHLSPVQRAALDLIIEARKEDASFITGVINVTKKVTPTLVRVTPTLLEAAVGASARQVTGPEVSGDPGLDELIRYRESLR